MPSESCLHATGWYGVLRGRRRPAYASLRTHSPSPRRPTLWTFLAECTCDFSTESCKFNLNVPPPSKLPARSRSHVTGTAGRYSP
eukprot:1414332-Rhodomonas_salina.1